MLQAIVLLLRCAGVDESFITEISLSDPKHFSDPASYPTLTAAQRTAIAAKFDLILLDAQMPVSYIVQPIP
jgi:CheY-like chemotaxis protein